MARSGFIYSLNPLNFPRIIRKESRTTTVDLTALAKGIKTQQGVQLGCEGETGKGATFFFTLNTGSS